MKKHPEKYEIRHVNIYGEVGAGTVVPFAPRNELVPIVVPAGSPADEHLGTLIVRGISLENCGIRDGDLLLLRKDITRKDITPETICAVYIRSTGELLAKKLLYGNRGDHVTLRSSGGGIKDVHYPAEDIEVRGIVFGFQRMRDEYGRFTKEGDGIPF